MSKRRKRQNSSQSSNNNTTGTSIYNNKQMLIGRQDPAWYLRQLQSEVGLETRIITDKDWREPLADRKASLGCYYMLSRGQYSDSLWRSLVDKMETLYSDYSNQQGRKSFFGQVAPKAALVPGLDFRTDPDYTRRQSAEIMRYAKSYVKHLTRILNLTVEWLSLLRLQSFDFTSRRIAEGLKFTALNTLWTQLGAVPCIKKIVDDIVAHARILRYDTPNKDVMLFVPMYIDPDTHYIDQYELFFDKNLDTDNFGPDERIYGPKFWGPLHDWDCCRQWQVNWYTQWWPLPPQVSAYRREFHGFGKYADFGYLVSSIRTGLEAEIEYFIRKYSSEMMSTKGDIYHILTTGTSEFPGIQLIDSSVTLDYLKGLIHSAPLGDALDYAANHMQYCDVPQPVLEVAGSSIHDGTIDPFTNDDGTYSTTYHYRDNDAWLRKRELVDDVVKKLTSAGADEWAKRKQLRRLGAEMGLFTTDKNELNMLQEWATFTSGQIKTAGDVLDEVVKYREFSPDWQKWSWVGDTTIGWFETQDDGIFDFADTPFKDGYGSDAFKTGIHGVGSLLPTVLMNNAAQGHVGHHVWLRSIIMAISAQAVHYTGKPGQMAIDIKGMDGDQGYWYVDLDEVSRGIIAPHWAIKPLTNKHDPIQCGFCIVISKESTEQGTPNSQPDPWGYFFSKGMLEDGQQIDLDIYTHVNLWHTGTDDLTDSRYLFKDMIAYIGDAIGDRPLDHFQRLDIAPYIWMDYDTILPEITENNGVQYPVKPFVNRKLSFPKVLPDVRGTFGTAWDNSLGTFEIYPAGAIVTTRVDTDRVMQVYGTRNGPMDRMAYAWSYWNPDLIDDPDHPFPEQLYGYITEGARRFSAILSNSGLQEFIESHTLWTEIAERALDNEALAVLKTGGAKMGTPPVLKEEIRGRRHVSGARKSYFRRRKSNGEESTSGGRDRPKDSRVRNSGSKGANGSSYRSDKDSNRSGGHATSEAKTEASGEIGTNKELDSSSAAAAGSTTVKTATDAAKKASSDTSYST